MGHLDTIRPEISFRAINLGSAAQNILRYGLDETEKFLLVPHPRIPDENNNGAERGMHSASPYASFQKAVGSSQQLQPTSLC
jgi:hypothetical protein